MPGEIERPNGEVIVAGQLPQAFVDITPPQGTTIFDKSVEGRIGSVLPEPEVPLSELPPDEYLRSAVPLLPQITEPEVKRHFVQVGNQNFSIGKGPYPLGSCTMKYNPVRHEEIAAMAGFANAHPEQRTETIQGTLQMMFELQHYLSELTGMDAATLAPMGGAHGELTGVLMIKALHAKNGEDRQRRVMLVPDSAHGTNPATASMAGYDVVEVKSGRDGNIDMDDMRPKVNENVAGLMVTMPNTLGLFDQNIFQATELIHRAGGLVYGDGANMNALMGKAKPRDFGVDTMHLNTHKALTTPHGGGGPGAGPVMVTEELADFLPDPVVMYDEEAGLYRFAKPKDTIGKIDGWSGNVGVLLRAYAYIRTMGEEGLRNATESAVLNANYLKQLLSKDYEIQFGEGRRVMHEVVVKGNPRGSALTSAHANIDVAKRLIDYGFHPPTVSFPLIADQALMIEPTETEGKEGIDKLAKAMQLIAEEARENPQVLQDAPHFTPVGRLDEATAARRPVLRWRPPVQEDAE